MWSCREKFYQLFKLDHVSQWDEHFEMRGSEVLEWLRDVGAVGTPVPDLYAFAGVCLCFVEVAKF